MEINNFRNCQRLNLDPGYSLNIIRGDNGQGKTNILEAIYVSCTGKSFRSFRDSEMICWDSDYALLNSVVETAGRNFEI
jgi:DNA replication and repair protein RecF